MRDSSGCVARLLVFLLLLGLFPLASPATDNTGTFVGTVTDPSGAAVKGARVTVRNEATNVTREVSADVEGNYRIAFLPPGTYQVTFEAQGFRRAVYKNVRLDVDQSVRVDHTLQLGPVTEEIQVIEAIPVIETETSTIGQVVDRQKVNELPLNERNFLTFTLLVPGAQFGAEGSQNATQGGAVSVNGIREQSNTFLLDGVDNSDSYINQYTVLPSVEAIQEFKVQSSNSSAEFGRGAQINVVLRSGSNDFHGSAFEFLRNRRLDAKNFFDLPDCTSTSVAGTCASIPRYDRNQFGGSLGGPLKRDKTFFFGAYEGLRLRQATTRQATVPSQMERMIALMAVPEIMRNPAGVAVFNLYPAANVGPDLVNSNTFVAAPVIRSTDDLFLVRMDHQGGTADEFSGHYSFARQKRFNPYDPLNAFSNLPGYGSLVRTRGQNVAFAWTHAFNARRLNQFRFGFNRLRAGIFQEHVGVDKNAELGFPTVSTNSVDLGYPNITMTGFENIGEPVNYPQNRRDTSFQFIDNLALQPWVNHNIKMGIDIRHFRLNAFLDFISRGDWFFQGFGTGNPQQALIQLLFGAPDFALATRGTTDHGLRRTGLSVYFQDDVRIRPRLVMNLGMRYEFSSPTREAKNRFSVPDLSPNSLLCTPKPDCQFIPAGTQGIPNATYESDRNNFAPRVGLAWRPMKSERFVVRTSYGIFYDAGILNGNIFPRFNPPYFEVVFFPNTGTNVIQDIFTTTGAALPQANFLDRHFRDGYVQQWNLDLQYELRANWMIDAAYVGSKGTHLEGVRDMNQARPGTGMQPFPQFISVLAIEPRSSSTYHALQLRSEKRLGQGLTFLAAYTWSRSIDDASAVFGSGVDPGIPQDSENAMAERGLSDFHAGHRFVFSYLYQLPFGEGKRWLNSGNVKNRLLGDWQVGGIVTLQTGHPYTINLGLNRAQSAFAAFGVSDRPDVIADPFHAGPVPSNPDSGPAFDCTRTQSQGGAAADATRTVSSWVNPCAFAHPPASRFGNLGRNAVIGPALANFDFTILKSFRLGNPNHRLQARLDFYNLFNHPNFDAPNRIIDSPSFGRLQSANLDGNKPPRQVQLAIRYVF